jgi:hypothetical protein
LEVVVTTALALAVALVPRRVRVAFDAVEAATRLVANVDLMVVVDLVDVVDLRLVSTVVVLAMVCGVMQASVWRSQHHARLPMDHVLSQRAAPFWQSKG